jgi:hypothetical protein
LSDVVVVGGNALTVMFEVMGLEVVAVRLNVERGDVGFVDVWAGIGCEAFLCVTFEVLRPKRFVIEVAVSGVDVVVVVGFVGDADLDDLLDSPDA